MASLEHADLLDEIAAHAHRFAGVHVNDWREPTRGWADRVLPGDGVADVPAILAALDAAGWDGYYDLEIFSDNGAFGTAYPDSLWDVEPPSSCAVAASASSVWERTEGRGMSRPNERRRMKNRDERALRSLVVAVGAGVLAATAAARDRHDGREARRS